MRPIQQDSDILDILDRFVEGLAHWYVQPVSHVPPRHDCIEAEPITKFFAQFADMALDHAFVECRLKYAIDRVEYLRLGDPFPVVAGHVFEDAQFASRQSQGSVADYRVAPVEEDLDAVFIWPR